MDYNKNRWNTHHSIRHRRDWQGPVIPQHCRKTNDDTEVVNQQNCQVTHGTHPINARSADNPGPDVGPHGRAYSPLPSPISRHATHTSGKTRVLSKEQTRDRKAACSLSVCVFGCLCKTFLVRTFSAWPVGIAGYGGVNRCGAYYITDGCFFFIGIVKDNHSPNYQECLYTVSEGVAIVRFYF